MTIFDFTSESNISNWKIVDDVVMGGRSDGNFEINSEGHGAFSGEVSLENNGGFSSLHYYFEAEKTDQFSKFVIRLKGDDKEYQFRVKNSQNQRHSYIYKFNTTGNWQTIEIPFSKMTASFRGNALDLDNYNGKQMEEIVFLIGNKKAESFKLVLDSIKVE